MTSTVLLAYLAIYLIWGSTFLAIRLAIGSMPPLLMMGVRCTIAGGLLLAAAALRGDRPAEALAATNDVLFDPLGRAGRFLTAFIARLDLVTGELAYADAGHGHAAVVTADGERPLPVGGHPLGLLPGVSYEEGVVTLGPGDRLAVFSDGLVEGDGDLQDARDALLANIRAGVRPEVLVVDAPDADDRTMVVVERVA